MKYCLYLIVLLLSATFSAKAQKDSAAETLPDTTQQKFFYRTYIGDSTKITNQDAIYTRPFIGLGESKTAVGGYAEANTNYFATDGVSEGFSMEMRRFNVFLYSSISDRIKLLSEIEFEHGTEEIALETAQIDFTINQLLNFRGGILLPQIGIFNVNHDSPRWDFIDRPLSSTKIIPSTLSEIGFGIYGKMFAGGNIISYNAYLVNGLRDDVILNKEGRTFLPAGKSAEMFGEDNNGVPMLNGSLSVANRSAGEIGVSYYGGVYNTFRKDGVAIDERRYLHLAAVNFSGQIANLTVQGEYIYAKIDVPENINEIYGTIQNGGFFEMLYPVVQKRIFGYENARINANIRLENIDYNFGRFSKTSGITGEIGDEVRSIVGGFSFRPTPSTAFKANYRYQWDFDELGNPPSRTAGFQFGFATYF